MSGGHTLSRRNRSFTEVFTMMTAKRLIVIFLAIADLLMANEDQITEIRIGKKMVDQQCQSNCEFSGTQVNTPSKRWPNLETSPETLAPTFAS